MSLLDSYDKATKNLVQSLDILYKDQKVNSYKFALSEEGLKWQLKNEVKKQELARDVEKAINKAYLLNGMKASGANLPSIEKFIKSKSFDDNIILKGNIASTEAFIDEKVLTLLTDPKFVYTIRTYADSKGWSEENVQKLKSWEAFLSEKDKQTTNIITQNKNKAIKTSLDTAKLSAIGNMIKGQTKAPELIKFASNEKFVDDFSTLAKQLIQGSGNLEAIKQGNNIIEKLAKLKDAIEIAKNSPPLGRQEVLEEKVKLALLDKGDVIDSGFFASKPFFSAAFSQLITNHDFLTKIKQDLEKGVNLEDQLVKARSKFSEKVFTILESSANSKNWPADKVQKIQDWGQQNKDFYKALEQVQKGDFDGDIVELINQHYAATKEIFKVLGDLPSISGLKSEEQKDIGDFKAQSNDFYQPLLNVAKDYIPKSFSAKIDKLEEYFKEQSQNKGILAAASKGKEEAKKAAAPHSKEYFKNLQKANDELRKEKYEGLEKKIIELFNVDGKEKLEKLTKANLSYEAILSSMSDQDFIEELSSYANYWGDKRGFNKDFTETLTQWISVLKEADKQYPQEQGAAIKAFAWVLGLQKKEESATKKADKLLDKAGFIEQQLKLTFVKPEAFKNIKFFDSDYFKQAITLFTLGDKDALDKFTSAAAPELKIILTQLSKDIDRVDKDGAVAKSTAINEEFAKQFNVDKMGEKGEVLTLIKNYITNYDFDKDAVIKNLSNHKYVEQLLQQVKEGKTQVKLSDGDIEKLKQWQIKLESIKSKTKENVDDFLKSKIKSIDEAFTKLLTQQDQIAKDDFIQVHGDGKGFIEKSIIAPISNRIIEPVLGKGGGIAGTLVGGAFSVLKFIASPVYKLAQYTIIDPLFSSGKLLEPLVNNPATHFLFGAGKAEELMNSAAEKELLNTIIKLNNTSKYDIGKLLAKFDFIGKDTNNPITLKVNTESRKLVDSLSIKLGDKISGSLKEFQDKIQGKYKILVNDQLNNLGKNLLGQIGSHSIVIDKEWEDIVHNFIKKLTTGLDTNIELHFIRTQETALQAQMENLLERTAGEMKIKLGEILNEIEHKTKSDLDVFIQRANKGHFQELEKAYKESEVIEERTIVNPKETLVKTIVYKENTKSIIIKKVVEQPKKKGQLDAKFTEQEVSKQVITFGKDLGAIDDPMKILEVILERIDDKNKDTLEKFLSKLTDIFDNEFVNIVNDVDSQMTTALEGFIKNYSSYYDSSSEEILGKMLDVYKYGFAKGGAGTDSQIGKEFKYELDKLTSKMPADVEKEFHFSEGGSQAILSFIREASTNKATFQNIYEISKSRGAFSEDEFNKKIEYLKEITNKDLLKHDAAAVNKLSDLDFLRKLDVSNLNPEDIAKVKEFITHLEERENVLKHLSNMHQYEQELKALEEKNSSTGGTTTKLDINNLKEVEGYLDTSSELLAYSWWDTIFKHRGGKAIDNTLPDSQIHDKYKLIIHEVIEVAKLKFFSDLVELKKLSTTCEVTGGSSFKKCEDYLKSYNVALEQFSEIFNDYQHDSQLISGGVFKLSQLPPEEKQLLDHYSITLPTIEDQGVWQEVFKQYSDLIDHHNFEVLKVEVDHSKFTSLDTDLKDDL